MDDEHDSTQLKHALGRFRAKWIPVRVKKTHQDKKPDLNGIKGMSDRLLVLLRHGESEWNLKNLFTGWKDPDLTPKGIEEAKAAGQRLRARGLAFDLAFTSELIRAQHTLDLTLAELGQSGLPVILDQALNERDYGDL